MEGQQGPQLKKDLYKDTYKKRPFCEGEKGGTFFGSVEGGPGGSRDPQLKKIFVCESGGGGRRAPYKKRSSLGVLDGGSARPLLKKDLFGRVGGSARGLEGSPTKKKPFWEDGREGAQGPLLKKTFKKTPIKKTFFGRVRRGGGF